MTKYNNTGTFENYSLEYEELPKSNSGKTRKYLTKSKVGRILKPVNKLRKDDKMAHDKNKTNKSNKLDFVKSLAWLLEAAFRFFVGWILLSKFDHYITTVAALYALGTGAVIVITHFVKAHK